MTWDIEADVYIDRREEMAFVHALVDYFSQHFEYLYVKITRGYWPVEEICHHRFHGTTALDDLERMIAAESAPDRTILIGLSLHGRVGLRYEPQPEVYLFGGERDGHRNHRRYAPVVLGFGNRHAWRGDVTLPTGLALSETTLAQALRHICTVARPRSLYLNPEEQASIPFNDHFVFHADISDYARDLEDIAQLCLYGGQSRYDDVRGDYEPALTTWPTMLFCKRPADWLDALRRFLAGKLPRLEKRGIPRKLPLAMVEDAALESGDLEFFFTEDGGLGIYVEKLFTTYVEGFYLALIDEILGETDQDGPPAIR